MLLIASVEFVRTLAIARQIIVEKHGGRLTVQSELGQGTEFCIQLPF
ncbi:MAG: ATP-binding protein [Cyanobacteria bacterium J06627_28]